MGCNLIRKWGRAGPFLLTKLSKITGHALEPIVHTGASVPAMGSELNENNFDPPGFHFSTAATLPFGTIYYMPRAPMHQNASRAADKQTSLRGRSPLF